ncbi:hypothetical protein L596_004657 [Steinernema carpocapsae]|uniref:Sema domain-containing protein n=1 Tax=Steinernema carpocapsae TaxID=34508 RepID=A0A4U8V0M4_STECR|nr:hypothetical protein L596_004657 [Steinernema carpocapsae]
MSPSTSSSLLLRPTAESRRSRWPSRESRRASAPSPSNFSTHDQEHYSSQDSSNDFECSSQVANAVRCFPRTSSRGSFRSPSGYHLWPRPTFLCLLYLFLLALPDCCVSSKSVTFLNPDRNEGPFEKMVIDPKTERVYVGGVNRLYELNPDQLNIKTSAITGPEPPPDCDGLSCRPLPTFSKALTIYDDQLIECASSHDGKCRTRNLYNITKIEKESTSAVVANDRDSTSVIFVGNGPKFPNSTTDSSPSVLYVASTAVVGRQVDVPALSSLSLDANNMFTIYHKAIGTGTHLQIERGVRDSYLIDYIGGFSAQNDPFVYFASRQPKDLMNPLIGSKLVRVCRNDLHYLSYVEMPLECKAGVVNYNILVDIYLGKPGYDMAANLSIETSSDILFAVFSRGDGDSRNISTTESALCVYSLDRIGREFRETIENCFRGGDGMQKNLPWFKSRGACQNTEYTFEQVMCGKDVNQLIGGSKPISASPVITSSKSRFTSVVSSSVGRRRRNCPENSRYRP